MSGMEKYFKIVEMVLACSCLGLHWHSFAAESQLVQMFISTTYYVFPAVLIAVVTTSLVGGRQLPKPADIFLSMVGIALFMACGVVNIGYFHGRWVVWDLWDQQDMSDIGLVKGYVSCLNAFVFLANLVFAAATK